jgi:MarR-like DNA-binding transcriptional regulator SgrR of sgrS sRNA
MRVQVLEQLEWDRMEAEMQTRARSTSAPPPRALLAGLPPPAPPPRRPAQPLSLEDYNQQKNRERSRVTYAALLESNRTDAQLLAPLIEAFYEIKFAPTFQGYMDEEIGWLNLNS